MLLNLSHSSPLFFKAILSTTQPETKTQFFSLVIKTRSETAEVRPRRSSMVFTVVLCHAKSLKLCTSNHAFKQFDGPNNETAVDMCIFLYTRFGFHRILLKENERRIANIKPWCTQICVIFNDTLFGQHYHEQFIQEFHSLQYCLCVVYTDITGTVCTFLFVQLASRSRNQ
jgi:hypothetical protein